MRVLDREVFIRNRDERPVFPGFVTYVSRHEPILLHRFGWEDYSDGFDDFSDSFSYDNGQTWTEPITRLKSCSVPGGRMRYAENAGYFDAQSGRLFTFIARCFCPWSGQPYRSADRLDPDGRFEIMVDSYDYRVRSWSGLTSLGLSLPGGIALSSCFPVKIGEGALVIPGMTLLLDQSGKPVHYWDCWAPCYQPVAIVARIRDDGSLDCSLGAPVEVDLEKSSRGLDENAIAELRDGRLAMVCRGDNSMFPERPGYKWACFSSDSGLHWRRPSPLPCDRGDPIESSASCCAMFRSIRNGKLYWLGNLCIHGRRPNGNFPRTPLVIAEVREDPFALIRDTITVVDQQQPGEPDVVQMSNFRFYQDRETGDLVLFLTRYSERDAKDWKQADYYRYRVELS